MIVLIGDTHSIYARIELYGKVTLYTLTFNSELSTYDKKKKNE